MAKKCSQDYDLHGLNIDCEGTIGGIKEVYIANYADVDTVTVTANKIATITMKSSATFKTYRFRKDTANMVSTAEFNEQNGTRRVLTDLNLQFSKMESAKRLEIMALFNGQTAVIVKSNDNTYWYLGKDNYVSMKAGAGQTGTTGSDLNGYTLTLNDESKQFPYEVDKTWIEGEGTTIIAAVPDPGDATEEVI